MMLLQVDVEWLALQLRSLRVPRSILGPEDGFHDREVFRCFLQNLPASSFIISSSFEAEAHFNNI